MAPGRSPLLGATRRSSEWEIDTFEAELPDVACYKGKSQYEPRFDMWGPWEVQQDAALVLSVGCTTAAKSAARLIGSSRCTDGLGNIDTDVECLEAWSSAFAAEDCPAEMLLDLLAASDELLGG